MAGSIGRIISVDEVQTSPRGRTAQYDEELLTLLGDLTPDTAVVVEGFGSVPKEKRSAVSANIRKHFAAAHGEGVKCRIEYSPEDSYPQVRFQD